MKRLALLMLCGVGTAAHYALAQDSTAADILRAGCAGDVQRFCANVAPGGGRIIACLREHRDVVSDQCKQAAAKVAAMSGNPGSNSNPTPNSAPSTPGVFPNSAATSSDLGTPPSAPAAPPAANPSATKSSASSSRRSSSSSTARGSYVVLKKVQITDPGQANMYASMPAVDLLVPPDWDLKGGVTFGGGKGGCFSDLMAVSWKATSPEGSAFWGLPNYSWQYTTDPTKVRSLNDPQRRQASVGGKPCPVAQPMKAEDYFRQNVAPQLLSHTVVSVEPYPELNQMVRRQLGLPAADGGNESVRTEAIRARLEFQQDGKPMEGWVTAAVVTRAYSAGRGTFWDCQAIDTMGFTQPKGKLDANEKLFKVMISSVRPLPQWQAASNSVINKLYQFQAQQHAIQDQEIAAFQSKVIQTINATTANAQRGAQQAAFGEGQLIRGVQTFRDPATGHTLELSNQYDHAWLNGSNEYVMSDDPNFNPNSQLSGSWNELQVVRPSP
jgi:hypothetical protein